MHNKEIKLSIRNAVICEDVRQYNNNKFIIIGVYSNDIVADSFPATINLSLYSEILIDRVGVFQVYARILVNDTMIVSAELAFSGRGPNDVATVIFPPVVLHLPSESIVTFQISTDNETWDDLAQKRVITKPVPAL